jgi:hypothetical protein
MGKVLSSSQITRLKREAKLLMREMNVPRHEALKILAQREGHPNWELLDRASTADNRSAATPSQQPSTAGTHEEASTRATIESVRTACTAFIDGLDDHDVYLLCQSGSIWIDHRDFLDGTVDAGSLQALGRTMEGVTRQAGYRQGLRPLVNLEGLAERFVFPGDKDDDGNPMVPEPGQVRYSTAVGRQELLECLDTDLEGDYDGLIAALADEDTRRQEREWGR